MGDDIAIEELRAWADRYFAGITPEKLRRDLAEANPHTNRWNEQPETTMTNPKLTIDVTPHTNGLITGRLTQTRLDGMMHEVESWVLDTTEEAMRRALIALGWTPPGAWQSIDTAPKDGTVILGALLGSDVPTPVRFRGGKWIVSWDHHVLSEWDGPTHWMPLPKRPEEQR